MDLGSIQSGTLVLGICSPLVLGALFLIEARRDNGGERPDDQENDQPIRSGEAIALAREGAELRARIGQDDFKLNRDARAWGDRVRRFVEIQNDGIRRASGTGRRDP